MSGALRAICAIGSLLSTQAALSFELAFGEGSTILNAVTLDGSGDIVVAGSVTIRRSAEETDFDNDAYLAAFSRSGEKLWERYYGGDRDESFTTATLLPGGDLLLAGAVGKPTEFRLFDNYCAVMRVGPTGDVIWQQLFEAGDNCEVVAVDVVANLGLAIAGKSGLVAHMTLDGEIVWNVQVPGHTTAFRTVTLLDGGRVVVGTAGKWPALALGADGTVVAEESLGWDVVLAERLTPGAVFTLLGNSALVFGMMSSGGAWDEFNEIRIEPYIREWPDVRTALGERDGSLLLAGSADSSTVKPTPADEIAALAGTSLRDTDGWLLRFDGRSREIVQATFGRENASEWFNAIVALPEGGYAAVGGTGRGGWASGTSAWLITIGEDFGPY